MYVCSSSAYLCTRWIFTTHILALLVYSALKLHKIVQIREIALIASKEKNKFPGSFPKIELRTYSNSSKKTGLWTSAHANIRKTWTANSSELRFFYQNRIMNPPEPSKNLELRTHKVDSTQQCKHLLPPHGFSIFLALCAFAWDGWHVAQGVNSM